MPGVSQQAQLERVAWCKDLEADDNNDDVENDEENSRMLRRTASDSAGAAADRSDKRTPHHHHHHHTTSTQLTTGVSVEGFVAGAYGTAGCEAASGRNNAGFIVENDENREAGVKRYQKFIS